MLSISDSDEESFHQSCGTSWGPFVRAPSCPTVGSGMTFSGGKPQGQVEEPGLEFRPLHMAAGQWHKEVGCVDENVLKASHVLCTG